GTNYNDQSGTGAVVIGKGEASCVMTTYSGAYDAAFHGIGAVCSCVDTGGAAGGGSVTNTDTFKNGAGGTAHWSFAGGTNYNDQSGTGAVVIGARPITIRANNQNKVLGTSFVFAGTEFSLSAGSLAPGESISSVTLNS